jgi:hypothetical protein
LPGKENVVADILNRFPVNSAGELPPEFPPENEVMIAKMEAIITTKLKFALKNIGLHQRLYHNMFQNVIAWRLCVPEPLMGNS